MSEAPQLSLHDLNEKVWILTAIVLAMRDELGEQGDGRPTRQIHPRIEKLETEFYKRRT